MAKPQFTFKQFQALYPDDAACLTAILQRRYGAADTCPHCGVVGKLTRIEGRRAFACKEGCHVYPCAGTVFEKSSTSLTTWFHCMYLMTATRNGVSAKEIQRQTGVTYKCAWRIGHQIRDLMAARAKAQNPGPLSGHVEVDETFIGGRVKTGKRVVRNKKATVREHMKNKTIVFGAVERGGDVRPIVIQDDKRVSILPLVKANIAEGSIVSSDTAKVYGKLSRMGYEHGKVNHNIEQWANGIHHTNTIEGFWSHLKRGIKSTHVAVSRQHLQNYVDEFAFRYNNREAPADMFGRMLAQISKPTSA